VAGKRGLDGRAQDKDGRIREKSGATKMKTLAQEYPECRAFTPDATLGGVRTRYGVTSVDEVRALGSRKLREQRNR
jgi:hypothetical protein